jgi:hypothetical protein
VLLFPHRNKSSFQNVMFPSYLEFRMHPVVYTIIIILYIHLITNVQILPVENDRYNADLEFCTQINIHFGMTEKLHSFRFLTNGNNHLLFTDQRNYVSTTCCTTWYNTERIFLVDVCKTLPIVIQITFHFKVHLIKHFLIRSSLGLCYVGLTNSGSGNRI